MCCSGHKNINKILIKQVYTKLYYIQSSKVVMQWTVEKNVQQLNINYIIYINMFIFVHTHIYLKLIHNNKK